MRKSTRAAARYKINKTVTHEKKDNNNNNITNNLNNNNNMDNNIEIDNTLNNINDNDEIEFQVWLAEGYDIKSDPKWSKYEAWKSNKGHKTNVSVTVLPTIPENTRLVLSNNIDLTQTSSDYIQQYIREPLGKSLLSNINVNVEEYCKIIKIDGISKVEFALFEKNSYVFSFFALKHCMQIKRALRFRRSESGLTILEQLFSYCRSPSVTLEAENLYARKQRDTSLSITKDDLEKICHYLISTLFSANVFSERQWAQVYDCNCYIGSSFYDRIVQSARNRKQYLNGSNLSYKRRGLQIQDENQRRKAKRRNTKCITFEQDDPEDGIINGISSFKSALAECLPTYSSIAKSDNQNSFININPCEIRQKQQKDVDCMFPFESSISKNVYTTLTPNRYKPLNIDLILRSISHDQKVQLISRLSQTR